MSFITDIKKFLESTQLSITIQNQQQSAEPSQKSLKPSLKSKPSLSQLNVICLDQKSLQEFLKKAMKIKILDLKLIKALYAISLLPGNEKVLNILNHII